MNKRHPVLWHEPSLTGPAMGTGTGTATGIGCTMGTGTGTP